jgi:hypothetical protein
VLHCAIPEAVDSFLRRYTFLTCQSHTAGIVSTCCPVCEGFWSDLDLHRIESQSFGTRSKTRNLSQFEIIRLMLLGLSCFMFDNAVSVHLFIQGVTKRALQWYSKR